MSKRKIAELKQVLRSCDGSEIAAAIESMPYAKRVKFATDDMTRRMGQAIRVRETAQLRKAFQFIFNDKRDRFQIVAQGAEAKLWLATLFLVNSPFGEHVRYIEEAEFLDGFLQVMAVAASHLELGKSTARVSFGVGYVDDTISHESWLDSNEEIIASRSVKTAKRSLNSLETRYPLVEVVEDEDEEDYATLTDSESEEGR